MIIGVSPAAIVTHWNQRARLITGISTESARNRHITSVLPGINELTYLIDTAVTSREMQQLIVQSEIGGELRYLDLTVLPLETKEDSGAVIRIDDISERRRMRNMLIQSEKMMSVGGLAAGMAHEINNPLAGIIQSIQVIRNRLFQETNKNKRAAETTGLSFDSLQGYLKLRNLDEMVAIIMNSGQRASRIVNNMLSFSRKSDSVKKQVSIPDLLDKTLELASNEYDLKKNFDFRKIEIIKEYDEYLPVIKCDYGQIQQVLLNILKNGAQSMFQVEDRESVFTIRLHSDSQWLTIEVEDNGVGMTQDQHKRVFEPFYTTKAVGKGTGLGLSVSYFIISENHGGELECVPRQDQGCLFIIRLPINPADSQEFIRIGSEL